jgi:hypothetical protein
MIGAKAPLADGERALEERLGLGVAVLVSVEEAKVVKARGGNGMIRAEDALAEGEGALVEGLGLGVAALLAV